MKKSIYKWAAAATTLSLLVGGTLVGVSNAGAGTQNRHGWAPEQRFQGNGPWQVDNNSATVQKNCATPVPNEASCDSLVMGYDSTSGQDPFHSGATPLDQVQFNGIAQNYYAYSPSQIIQAYNFPTTTASGALPGTGETIGIIDANDDPNIASDLATFDTDEGIPALPSCTISATSGPCFEKVNELGQTTTFPAYDASWALEISLDVEYAHAIAPGASILLVEASSESYLDIARAIQYVSTKAQYVSMSFGISEAVAEKSYDTAFNAKVSYFAAAGDQGVGAQWPSSSPKVISVGGTTLTLNPSGSIASETGWVNGGGGCSAVETATANQASYPTYSQSGCNGMRATPDVAADGDPNTGVLVYDSNVVSGTTGWFTVGGTSLATPIWAARSADLGVVVNSAYIYGPNAINFHDITQGGNSAGCLVGYDMCSGLGSWNN